MCRESRLANASGLNFTTGIGGFSVVIDTCKSRNKYLISELIAKQLIDISTLFGGRV